MRRIYFFVFLFLVGCGSSDTSEKPVEITSNNQNAENNGGETNNEVEDPGRQPGDDNLGSWCDEDDSVCGELSCSNEFEFQEGRSSVCTRSCDFEKAFAEGVPACPIGFKCELDGTSRNSYCMPDLGVVVDVIFNNPYPHELDAEFDDDGLVLNWGITQPEPYDGSIDADYFEIFHGTDEDPPKLGETDEERYTVTELVDGQTYYWRVVAHFDEKTFESPVWSYTAREGEDDFCPGLETVVVGDRDVPTRIMSDGNCWLAENLGLGEVASGSYVNDDGVPEFICPSNGCNRGLYSWFEVHNSYPEEASDVPGSICPAGFRLPTRAEWETLLEGSSINGLRTVGKLHFDGQIRPTTGDIELCTNPQTGQRDMKCVRMGGPATVNNNAYYWTSDVPGAEPVRLNLVHEGSGVYSHEFRTARPTFASSVRCMMPL